jgi:phage FluMu gp28-like protein
MGAFKAVRTRVHDRSLELYDHLQLIAELCRLRVNYRPGSAEVVNPRTGVSHGDMAVAIALAVHEIDARGGGADLADAKESAAIESAAAARDAIKKGTIR